jgi:TrmH family RNA methyltransferase
MPLPIQTITSSQNPRFKQALKLRQRRARDRSARILIDGRREIELALRAGVAVHELFVSTSDADDDCRSVLSLLAERHPQMQVLVMPEALLGRISYGDRTHHWVAVASPPSTDLAHLQLGRTSLVAIIQGVEKPGNVGAIARSADAAGLDALIVADPATDVFNPNAIRASRGTLFSLPVFTSVTEVLLEWVKRHELQVAVARVDGAIDYTQCDFCRPTAIVLGSEAEGVTREWQSDKFLGLHLPMCGRADSLNVSTTAAVLFYEALRQRRQAAS